MGRINRARGHGNLAVGREMGGGRVLGVRRKNRAVVGHSIIGGGSSGWGGRGVEGCSESSALGVFGVAVDEVEVGTHVVLGV